MDNLSIILSNSIWFNNHKGSEVLKDPIWINSNLSHALEHTFVEITNHFLENLITLRSIAIHALTNGRLNDHILKLNELISQVEYTPEICVINEHIQLVNTTESSPESQVLVKIVTDLVHLFETNEIKNVSTCANDDCQFFFIDHSKNKSKKYCSTRCGNLIKVRRYRERH